MDLFILFLLSLLYWTLVSCLCKAGNQNHLWNCRSDSSLRRPLFEFGAYKWIHKSKKLQEATDLVTVFTFPQNWRNRFPIQSQWLHWVTSSGTSAFGPCLLYFDLMAVMISPLLGKENKWYFPACPPLPPPSLLGSWPSGCSPQRSTGPGAPLLPRLWPTS